jgi:hypothetical protein
MSAGRVACAAFILLLVGIPLVAPQFWVTLGNYVGLYSIVALGLVLLTGVAGQTSFGQAAVRRYRRLHDSRAVGAVRDVAVALALRGPAAHLRARVVPRLHHAADERALSAARDDRVGHQPVFPVRQRRDPGRATRG